MSGEYVVHGAPASGAVAVEAALILAGQPYRLVERDIWSDPDACAELAKVNPQKQLPALILPGGELMTESAAILIRLAELHPPLGPGLDSPLRPRFLRWMAYVSAQVYALYWGSDHPERLVPGAEAQQALQRRSWDRILHCWRTMDAQIKLEGLYLLGDEPGVLDIYVTVVSRWRPRRQAFYAAAPGLAEVVRRLDADPRLAALWADRYPFSPGWDL